MRTGLLVQKLGMTRRFDENGLHVPITVLKLDNVQVVAQRTAGTECPQHRPATEGCRFLSALIATRTTGQPEVLYALP